MSYKRGRFVIHYKDGSTYMEQRIADLNPQMSDEKILDLTLNFWDNRPRKPIKALAIQPDSNFLASVNEGIDPKTGKDKWKRIVINLDKRIRLDPIILKGSFKFNYGFFMDKFVNKQFTGNKKKDVYGIRIGVIVDNLGHCYCVEYVGNFSPRMYYTTCKSLHMDANSLKVNYDIDLEELPDPRDNFAPYPEINPLVLKERKERWKREAEARKRGKQQIDTALKMQDLEENN